MKMLNISTIMQLKTNHMQAYIERVHYYSIYYLISASGFSRSIAQSKGFDLVVNLNTDRIEELLEPVNPVVGK